MKFIIEFASKFSGRLGNIQHCEQTRIFETPQLLFTTKSGNLPYLSRELFDYVGQDQEILSISLANISHMEAAIEMYNGAINSYVGYKDFLTFMVFKDYCESSPSGLNEKNYVPLYTRRGKVPVTAERYMDFVKTFKPHMYHSLCDADTNLQSSKNRIIKSVERSKEFFKICSEKHKQSITLKNTLFFASIVGGYDKKARTKSIESVVTEPNVYGYWIDGFHNGGETSLDIEIEPLKEIVSHCLEILPIEKPKIMPGAYHPLTVLQLIQLGIDIFDTSYIYIMTKKFHALTFNSKLDAKYEKMQFSIDLSEQKYKYDFSPLFDDCTCKTCKDHTKAYLHHLVVTKELLGPILLTMHNTHHYIKFFDNIRCAIRQDKLPQIINLIMNQMRDEELNDIKTSKISELL